MSAYRHLSKSSIVLAKSLFLALFLFSLNIFLRVIETRPVRETTSATATSVIRARGFLAEDHYVTTSDGYVLNLVRATNPLINEGRSGLPHKEPILFIHGVLSNSNAFVVNSDKAKPMDYTNRDSNLMSQREWKQLVSSDGSSKSIVFMALNFGHEVWLLNRRGTSTSLGHIDLNRQALLNSPTDGSQVTVGNQQRSRGGLSRWLSLLPNLLSPLRAGGRRDVVNPKYWDFSLDVQVRVDMPTSIDYVLAKTYRDKLSLVAFSSGASLSVMVLAEQPQIANKTLWAPALRFEGQLRSVLAGFSLAAFSSYIGPVPMQEFDPSLRNGIATLCQSSFLRNTLCSGISDLIAGKVGNQQQLPNDIQIVLDSSGSGEVLQLIQAAITGKMHYFDYFNKTTNLMLYGRTEPPEYDVSRVTLRKMAFWGGDADTQVPISTLESLIKDMRVPVERHYINFTGTLFNHYSFIYHRYVAELVNIPTLRFLESA